MVVCSGFPVVIFNCIVGVLQRLARIPCFWWTFMALQTLLNHVYKFLFIQSSRKNYYISLNRKKIWCLVSEEKNPGVVANFPYCIAFVFTIPLLQSCKTLFYMFHLREEEYFGSFLVLLSELGINISRGIEWYMRFSLVHQLWLGRGGWKCRIKVLL